VDRYMALDTHDVSCTLGVMGSGGQKLGRQLVPTSAAALIAAVQAVRGRRHLVIEEGNLSAWLYETLVTYVDELVVVLPRKRQGSKSDEKDTWELADDLRLGRLDKRRVFKAPQLFACLRAAVRAHRFLTHDVVRTKNRLRAVFRSRGLCQTGDDLFDPEGRLVWLDRLPPAQRGLAQMLALQLDELLSVHERAEQALQEEAARHGIVRLLATGPGMGPIRAATLVAVVLSPERFPSVRHFWSYCGLAIVTEASAEYEQDDDGRWERVKKPRPVGLNRNRHPWLKEVFKGAANCVIGRMSGHHLHRHYERLLEGGTRPNLARLTLARRIASAELAMWKNKEAYDPEKHERQALRG